MRLSANGSWSGRPATVEDAVALATRMLPAHRSFDPDLYEEMEAMAMAAGISPAEAVIVGGFTDFVDVVRAGGATGLAEEDDCTAVIVPDELAGGAGFLAQTWDMHDSATEHVTMIRVAPDSGPGGIGVHDRRLPRPDRDERGRDRHWHQQPHRRQRAGRGHLALRRPQSPGTDVDRGRARGGPGG